MKEQQWINPNAPTNPDELQPNAKAKIELQNTVWLKFLNMQDF